MNSDTRRPADDASAEGWMEADRQALRAALPAQWSAVSLAMEMAVRHSAFWARPVAPMPDMRLKKI